LTDRGPQQAGGSVAPTGVKSTSDTGVGGGCGFTAACVLNSSATANLSPISPRRSTPSTSESRTTTPPVRTGAGWISRRVCANGWCVSWQQVSISRHCAGERCDVHVDGKLLRFWIGDNLAKTAARTSPGEVRNKRALRTSSKPQEAGFGNEAFRWTHATPSPTAVVKAVRCSIVRKTSGRRPMLPVYRHNVLAKARSFATAV
jgi:hypothetical protein